MSLSWDWDDGDDDELAALRDMVRRFIDKEIAPHHARWEREGQVSRELWRKAGELGLLQGQAQGRFNIDHQVFIARTRQALH